jgi:hypothetical protein
MWLKPDLIGPQKGPTTSARLRARWRSTEAENREACEVRAQWMRLIGCDEAEISESLRSSFDLDLNDELEQLAAAIQLDR